MSAGYLPKESLQNLKCHLCGKYLSVGPVKSVSLKGDKNQCGRCKDIPAQYNINNYCFQKVAQFVKFPCTFDGCEKMLKWDEVIGHEEVCEYATFQCPQLFCNEIVGLKSLNHHVYNHFYFIDKIENFALQEHHSHVLFIMKESQIFFVFLCHDGCFIYVGVYASQKLHKPTRFEMSLSSAEQTSLSNFTFGGTVIEYNDNYCFKCMRGYCGLKHHKYSTNYTRSKRNLRRVVLQIDFDATKRILNNPQEILCSFVVDESEKIATSDVAVQTDATSNLIENKLLSEEIELKNKVCQSNNKCQYCLAADIKGAIDVHEYYCMCWIRKIMM